MDVEITPVMIEAGLEAYWEHDREHDSSQDIVCDVFRAMSSAANGPTSEASWLIREGHQVFPR